MRRKWKQLRTILLVISCSTSVRLIAQDVQPTVVLFQNVRASTENRVRSQVPATYWFGVTRSYAFPPHPSQRTKELCRHHEGR